MDFFTSAVNYVSLKIARSPADLEHPYGHGKAEGLAGLFQGVTIGLSGLWLLFESVRRLLSGSQVGAGFYSIGAMALSSVVSAWHGWCLRQAARRENSPILRSEGVHFEMDMLSNLGVLFALVAIHFTKNPLWDVGISILITAYILREAFRVLWVSGQELMDRGMSDELRAELERIILTHHPNIIGFHDFRARKSGGKYFIDFHIEIRDIQGFQEAHDLTESLIDRVKNRLPGADVTVHYDPEGAR